MTRLQSRTASCECGKTTKESGSFVTKSKIYHTRSVGAGRTQGSLFADSEDLRLNNKISCENTLNLRGKIFMKKMKSSLIRVPVSNNKSFGLNSNSKIKLAKASTKSRDKKIVADDTARTIIGSALDDILASKLKLDMVETNCIRSNSTFEDFSVSNNFIPKEIVTHIEVETNAQLCDNLQNGDFNPVIYHENGLVSICKETIKKVSDNGCLLKESNIKKESNEKTIEFNGIEEKEEEKNLVKSNVNITESVLLNGSECCNKSLDLEQFNKKRKRRSAFEVLLDNCEIKVSSDKRIRKPRNSFSPITVLNSSITESTYIEKNPYTLSGRLKKKCGRKPRPRGPILHYLDVYVKNKDKPVVKEENLKDSVYVNEIASPSSGSLPFNLDANNDNVNLDCHLSIENLEQLDNLEDSVLKEKHITEKKRRGRKPKKHKNNIINKKTEDNKECSDENIQTILGYRNQNGIRELLVLFTNGTSTWVNEESDDYELVSSLNDYFTYSDQDLSIINRLAYQLAVESKESSCGDISDFQYSEGSTESDSESDVFVNKLPINKQELSHTMYPVNSMEILSPTRSTKQDNDKTLNLDVEVYSPCLNISSAYQSEKSDLFSASDLNNLCTYVMSSRHIKLYPYEMAQEVVSKEDEEFLHIYLKRLKKLPDDNRKLSDRLNLRSCEKLINILEDCAVNDVFKVVVISGVEDYFALNQVFEKLLKKPAAVEAKDYEQDVSMLR